MSPAEVPSSPNQPNAPAAENAAEATAAKHSLWSWASTTGLVALAALLLGAGALPWWLSNPQRLSGYIAQAAPDLQADITIGKAQIGWLGPLVLEEVTLVPRSGARSPATIARIEGSHGLAGMLLSAGDLGTFRIQGIRADVVFDANRDSNLKGLIAPPAGTITAVQGQPTAAAESNVPPAELPPQPRLSPVRARIEVEDAVVRIESRYNPSAHNAGAIGLMQIKHQTARGVGYGGSAAGLRQPDTNLRYGMKYLAQAYRMSGGDTCTTVMRYQSGHGAVRANGANRAYCAKARTIMARLD
jgi:hypothetical protein